jgi:hypothetical protein
MNRRLSGAVAVALLAPASHAQVASYSFSGTATGATPAGAVAVGTPVSGTVAFELANAIPSQSSGAAGSHCFLAQAYGGPEYGVPFPKGYVFTATANAGSLSYSSVAFAASCDAAESSLEDAAGEFL